MNKQRTQATRENSIVLLLVFRIAKVSQECACNKDQQSKPRWRPIQYLQGTSHMSKRANTLIQEEVHSVMDLKHSPHTVHHNASIQSEAFQLLGAMYVVFVAWLCTALCFVAQTQPVLQMNLHKTHSNKCWTIGSDQNWSRLRKWLVLTVTSHFPKSRIHIQPKPRNQSNAWIALRGLLLV